MKNLQNEEHFVKSLSNEMQNVLNSNYDHETKMFLIDDIYVNKICKWKFSDENLERLNGYYDICRDILKRSKS